MADLGKILSSLIEAETGSFDDPYIRTTANNVKGGSTAFGPAQITNGLISDFNNRGLLSNDSSQFYSTVLKPMYDKFIEYGNEPNKKGYDKEFDYGGGGYFNENEYSDEYNRLAMELIKQIAKNKKNNVQDIVERWRGKNEKAYNDRFYNAYNRI